MRDPEAVRRVQRTVANKVKQWRAADAQTVVGHRLRALGFVSVAPIATPKSLVGGVVRYGARVAGDFYALQAGTGRGVLVEVKRRDGTNVAHTSFESHQIGRLSQWQDAGGLALLAWVNPSIALDPIAIVPWDHVRAHLCKPGGSITWEHAVAHRLTPHR